MRFPGEEAHSLGSGSNLGRLGKPLLWGRDTGQIGIRMLEGRFLSAGPKKLLDERGAQGLHQRPFLAGLVCFINEPCKSKAELPLPQTGLFSSCQPPFFPSNNLVILRISIECFPDYKMLSRTLFCFHLLSVSGAGQGVMMMCVLHLSPREVW